MCAFCVCVCMLTRVKKYQRDMIKNLENYYSENLFHYDHFYLRKFAYLLGYALQKTLRYIRQPHTNDNVKLASFRL